MTGCELQTAHVIDDRRSESMDISPAFELCRVLSILYGKRDSD